jgi:sugar-specific transcriptional regulator TrmB
MHIPISDDLSVAVEALVKMGLTPLEAEIYAHLARGPVSTGYGIAKAIGKPTANVYKAVRTLQLKGAIVVDGGETQLCRAIPPQELLDRLDRQFHGHRDRAAEMLARLPAPSPDARVYRLSSVTQVTDRCRSMIGAATQEMAIDAFPDPLRAIIPDLEAAARRGIVVVVKAYAPCTIAGARVVVEPEADRVSERWPADWCNVVVDGSQFLVALLERNGTGVVQAIWSESPSLACIVHGYLFQEYITTLMNRAFSESADLETLRNRFREAQALIPRDTPGYRQLLREIRVHEEKTE